MNNDINKISIPTLLFKFSPKLLVFAVLLGLVVGALHSLIIPFVLHGVNHADVAIYKDILPDALFDLLSNHYAEMFFGMCTLILFTKAVSVIFLNNIAKSATAELRINISKKINRIAIEEVEKIGFPRLLNVLVDDVNNVSSAAVATPLLLIYTLTIVGMLSYLLVLNGYVFSIVLLSVFLGGALFQVPMFFAMKFYMRARALKDTLQEGIRGLVMGANELKLDSYKSAAYIDDAITDPQKGVVYQEKIGDAMLHVAGTFSELLSLFVIGVVAFFLPHFSTLTVTDNYAAIMALLFIAGPVGNILGLIQQLKVGQVAIGRVNNLFDIQEEGFISQNNCPEQWTTFSVRELTYTYSAELTGDLQQSFSLAPTNLSFTHGEITFIVGENGSGKSTLSKLLSLHYLPTSGAVLFDDVAIDDANISTARLRISVIFSDYYLFEKLYKPYTALDEAKIHRYLKALGLKEKTEFINGRFTTTKLSDGQRRRLALLIALIEDKDIYIFDEWAADQDPEFKKVFYEIILDDMRKDNKLVIVITHDDRYFNCADRIVFMAGGQVVDIKDLRLSTGPLRGQTISKYMPNLSFAD